MNDMNAEQKKLASLIQEELTAIFSTSSRIAQAIKELQRNGADVSITIVSAIEVQNVESAAETRQNAGVQQRVESKNLTEEDKTFLHMSRLTYHDT